MPPRRVRASASKPSRSSNRASIATPSRKQNAAGIYDDLLAEATSETDFHSHDEPPLKRRKPTLKVEQADRKCESTTIKGKELQQAPKESPATSTRPETASADDTSDSDLAFEDVDLENGSIADIDSDEDLEDVNISFGQNTRDDAESSARRKPLSRRDKALRVLGHKAHLAAMLGHCMIVNSRCNDRRVHRALAPILTDTMQSCLRPNRDHTQFQQNRTFVMGLERASDAFKNAFQITAPGMRRPYWQDEQDSSNIEDSAILDRTDFINAARQMSGSQDTGNQLFCALLRAARVRARIVCSLQLLPLANTSTAMHIPSKPAKRAVFAIAPDTPTDRIDNSNLSIRDRAVASARSRIGQPAFRDEAPPIRPSKKRSKASSKLAYPVFWTEVLNVAYQKWLPVDPLVTQTINKASKLEPPLSYPLSQLAYAIAFSKNGSAKDVTRRYAKAYNAKTRRIRLESISETESSWLHKVMRMFTKQTRSDTDIIEDSELSQRTAREGLPTKIQDFKDHPIYALERHLRRQEVIHPRREAGKVNAGSAANPKIESIFRREDVHVCRSADQWFRYGRTVKAGEQSLKLVPARLKRRDSEDESDHQEQSETALYILSQTELYIPDPVVRGRVPRNAFGNLDIYVPSMVPTGAIHIRHPMTKSAAQILQIDAVDAVTGFKFSNRRGTTVVEGAVVPEAYSEAVQTVIEGLLWQETDDRSRARSALALRMWKRLLQGLKIAERVATYATEAIPQNADTDTLEMSYSTAWYAEEEAPLHTAGRFTLDELVVMAKASKKTKAMKSKKRAVSGSDDDDDDGGEKSPEYMAETQSAWQMEDDDQLGGGFLPEPKDSLSDRHTFVTHDGDVGAEYGGGFFVDEDSAEAGYRSPRHLTRRTIDLTHGSVVQQPNEEHGRMTGEIPPDLPQSGGSYTLNPDGAFQSDPPPFRSPDKQDTAAADEGGSAGEHSSQATNVDKSTNEDSLLSHDPDDDDAEPDWMESD